MKNKIKQNGYPSKRIICKLVAIEKYNLYVDISMWWCHIKKSFRMRFVFNSVWRDLANLCRGYQCGGVI